jgi:hypothetical protein
MQPAQLMTADPDPTWVIALVDVFIYRQSDALR